MKEMRISFEILMISLLLTSSIMKGQEKLVNGIEKRIDSIFSSYEGKPGCAIAVIKNNRTLFQKGYGIANLEYEIPVSSKTIFDAPAFAKQFTAACIFLLEDEGKLSLDDPIQKYFPEFPDYAEGELRVKNLVYQTSGIRSYLAILFAQHKYFGDSFDNKQMLKMAINQQNLNFKPGLRHDYSNSNYALLANIIEKVSSKKLPEYAKEKLFDPLKMTNTFFIESPNKVVKNRAMAYQQEEDRFVLNHFFNSSVVGDGGLHSNLEDLVKWNNNLSTGNVGGKDLIAKMITPGILNSGAGAGYAGGLYFRNHYDIEGLPSIRHSGEWGGFRTLYYKFLDQDTAFIILSNNGDTNVWSLLDQLTPLFVAEEISAAQESATSSNELSTLTPMALTNDEKERFCGNFYNEINGNTRSIVIESSKLMYKRSTDSPATPLLAISKKELVFEVAPQLKLTFNTPLYNKMLLTVNDQDPTSFEKYKRHSYGVNQLKEFENQYYNQDLNVVYHIVRLNGELQILVEGEELVILTPFSQDMFRDEHFGFIRFLRDNKHKVSGFIRQDNTFSNLSFHKVDKSI